MSQRKIITPASGRVPSDTDMKLMMVGTMSNVAMLFGQAAQGFARLAVLDKERGDAPRRTDEIPDEEATNADLEYDLIEETAWYYKEAAEIASELLDEQRRRFGVPIIGGDKK